MIGAITAQDGLRLRKGPSTSTTALDLMPEGQVVEILEQRGDWYRVLWRRQEGWAYSRFVRVLEQHVIVQDSGSAWWVRAIILAGAAIMIGSLIIFFIASFII